MSDFDNFILKNSKVIISFFGFIFIVTFLMFLYAINNRYVFNKSIEENKSIAQITSQPHSEKVLAEVLKAETEWDIGERNMDTTEIIDLIAPKEAQGNFIAMIRLRVEGGEVIEVVSPYSVLQGCNQTRNIFEVCEDIVKSSPFVEGETIATLKIKWLNTQTQKIFKSAQYGYYNGSVFTSSN